MSTAVQAVGEELWGTVPADAGHVSGLVCLDFPGTAILDASPYSTDLVLSLLDETGADGFDSQSLLSKKDLSRLDAYTGYILIPKAGFPMPPDGVLQGRPALRISADAEWQGEVHDGTALLLIEGE